MANIKTKSSKLYSLTSVGDSKKSRKGIHAKTKQSKNKNSKNYVKQYRGQGR